MSNDYVDYGYRNAIVAVMGTVTRITAKAIEFNTVTDGVNRYFPLSSLAADFHPRVGGQYEIYVKLWRLKSVTAHTQYGLPRSWGCDDDDYHF